MALQSLPSRCISHLTPSVRLLGSRARPWAGPQPPRSRPSITRYLSSKPLDQDAPPDQDIPPDQDASFLQSWNEYKNFFHFPPASLAKDFKRGEIVTVHGFIGKRRDRSKKLSFVDIAVDDPVRLQLCSKWTEKSSPAHITHQELKAVPAWSSVAVTARVMQLSTTVPATDSIASQYSAVSPKFPAGIDFIGLELISVQILNPWPRNIIVSEGVQFPPSARHLQLRFHPDLRERMRLREDIKAVATEQLRSVEGLSETETPILFKSTPEGAREFLVPTRRPWLAYALPQSPQQYKQTLMAAGFGGYFQFARCFRDEDLRADRQPEFTQLDLEMAFATGEDVMGLVERLMKQVYKDIASNWVQDYGPGGWYPVRRAKWRAKDEEGREDPVRRIREYPNLEDGSFPRISYQDAMSLYGSDKPDLRIPGQIEQIQDALPAQFVSMISSIDKPIVDCWRCTFQNGTPTKHHKFLSKIMSNLPEALAINPNGAPVFLVHDSSKPLNGFSSLGFEAAEALTKDLQDGDVLVMQVRPDRPFAGGSTAMGTLRALIYNEAVEAGLMPQNLEFRFLWVTGFPMFTPSNDVDPGQGGSAGFSSTHHPFTAPLTSDDFSLLATDPLAARADHYDLVLNGVELGGGSRRIHVAHVQEYVFRNILGMTNKGVAQFRHLLEALRAGCPPHAGFALGFDRLTAMLSGTGSVRDVIAFPKTMKGEDPFAGSPSKMTPEQLQTYSLQVRALRE